MIDKTQVKPKDQRCAPAMEYSNGSCISLDLLIVMAKAYNKDNSKNKIILSSTLETLNPKKYKRYLIKQFGRDDILGKVCDNQRCWVKQDYIRQLSKKVRNKVTKNVFRPEGPSGFEWLNTFNINDVMKQYEAKYSTFFFLGAFPIDFEELSGPAGLKDFDFNDLINKQKKSKIGVIFNLDESYKSGSHWVSMFADMNKGHIFFFDSYGVKAEPRIRKFMRKLANFCKHNLKIEPYVDYNRKRHQYGNNACGIYSVNLIIRLLEGESFEHIIQSKLPDKIMNINRQIYFT